MRDHLTPPGDRLARQAAQAQSWARDLRQQRAEVAEVIAVTEARIAATMARLADQHPYCATRLRAMSQQASRHAADERRRAHTHRALVGSGRA